MKNLNFMSIDVSQDAVMAGNALQQAIQEGLDPKAFLEGIASNSLRPYIDPSDPFKQYVTVNAGIDPETGEPDYQAVFAGNAENTTLLRGEWEKIDTVIHGVAMGRNNLMNMLIAAGLTIPLDGMGTTKFTWRRTGQMGEARLDMDMTTEIDNDRMEWDELSIPVPIISSGWDVNMRYLMASRKAGTPIDTIKAYWAAYRVVEKAESLIINGAGTFKADGGSIYGLRNTPVALTATLQGDWSSDDIDGEAIVDEVAGWIQTLKNQHHYGPFSLILPQRYSHKLGKDYKAESDKSILMRIKELDGIGNITFTEQINFEANSTTTYANEVFLLELRTETIALLDGMGLTDFEWQKKGPFVKEHKVAMIRVPLFRNDMEDQAGLLYAKAAGTPVA